MTHLQVAAAFALAGSLAATSSAVDAPSGDTVVARVLTVPIRARELEPRKGLRNDSSMSDAAWTEHIRARQLERRIVEPLRAEFCRATPTWTTRPSATRSSG